MRVHVLVCAYALCVSPGQTSQRGRAKARQLLTEWLSPTQLAQYKRKGHFEVTGCHSGKRYRIRSNGQLNIDELDERDSTLVAWCFGPEGHLPIGDIMLAQKIALETNECASLEVANGNPARLPAYSTLP